MRGPDKKTLRLGHWTASPLTTQSQHSLRSLLCQPDVLTRLGVVLVATLLLSALAYGWGLPLPYRIGEVWAHDVEARVSFSLYDDTLTEHARDKAVQKLPPKLRDDPAARARAIASVEPVYKHYGAGTVIIQRGQQITEDQRNLMREETKAFQGSLQFAHKAKRFLALFLLMGLMATLVVLYVVRYQSKLAQDLGMIVRVCTLLVATHFFWLLLSRPPWHAGLLPLTFTAMVLAIAFRPQFALLICFSFCIALTASKGNNMAICSCRWAGRRWPSC
jgi:hypothetical protein